MTKLSSEKTEFIKKTFPIIGMVAYGFFLYITFFKGMIILLPLMLIFLLGFILFFIKINRVVDLYVDYNNKEFMVDNLYGKTFFYKHSELTSLKLNQWINVVNLKFKDGKKFTFYTKNLWTFPGFGYSKDVDAEIKALIS